MGGGGAFSSLVPEPNNSILAVSMVLWNGHSVPSLDRQGPQRLWGACLFLYTNSWTAPEAEDGHKPLHLSKNKASIYTFTFCLWGLLCMSNTIFDGATDAFKCSVFASWFLSLRCMFATKNMSKPCWNIGNVNPGAEGGPVWTLMSAFHSSKSGLTLICCLK